jgi:alpha-L-rhamnosidase
MKADPSMNSYNHYAYGAVADWLYRSVAGVDATPTDAGFHTVVLHPLFDARLGKVAFDYASAYGPIHSDWKMEGATVDWHVTIPANTTGWLPLTAAEAGEYKLEGSTIAQSKLVKAATHEGKTGYELGSGSYVFQVSVE